MRKFLVKVLLTLVSWLGYSPHGLPSSLLEAARFATDEVERKAVEWSGQAKRAQALRALMNLRPDTSERDLDFAIDVCLRR